MAAMILISPKRRGAGIGTAGALGGSLLLIMILLQQVGIPEDGIGIVLGVDRFFEKFRLCERK